MVPTSGVEIVIAFQQPAILLNMFMKIEKPVITIEYCPKCNWLLRAAYMAQEILTSFDQELEGVLLKPSDINGRYSIFINDRMIFDRKSHGGFLDTSELKLLLRDHVAPGKPMGHHERKKQDE